MTSPRVRGAIGARVAPGGSCARRRCRQVSMRAVGVTGFGGPEALHIVDVEPEPLGPGQVRLPVEAAAVSPTDTHARAGAYAGRDPVKTPPWVPGMDVAGVVTEVGDGVDHVAVGDLAMGIVIPFGPHGAYREDKVLPG